MFEKLAITRLAQQLSAHAGARVGVVARNMANADTPGFKAMDLPAFATLVTRSDLGLQATRAGHLIGSTAPAASQAMAVPGPASPDGNTVSVEGEMIRASEARQQHEMALAIYRATSEVLRTSLGRNR